MARLLLITMNGIEKAVKTNVHILKVTASTEDSVNQSSVGTCITAGNC